MHPMFLQTIASGIVAIMMALILPFIPLKARKVVLVVSVALICYFTLFRETRSVRQINLIPFWSYRKWDAADVRWQIYMNIFLFMPLGASLKSLNIKHPILIALAATVTVELLQYIFALGLCETDDVINNTLGAAVGSGLFVISKRKSRDLLRRLKPHFQRFVRKIKHLYKLKCRDVSRRSKKGEATGITNKHLSAK